MPRSRLHAEKRSRKLPPDFLSLAKALCIITTYTMENRACLHEEIMKPIDRRRMLRGVLRAPPWLA